MKNQTKVFVSYTTRDGEVNIDLLEKLYSNLQEICLPFADLVNRKNTDITQSTIFKEIFNSHLLIVIESEKVYDSPWVKLELFLSKFLLIPVIRLKASSLEAYLNKG